MDFLEIKGEKLFNHIYTCNIVVINSVLLNAKLDKALTNTESLLGFATSYSFNYAQELKICLLSAKKQNNHIRMKRNI